MVGTMILILGGSGYLAGEFARNLAARGVPFYALSRGEHDYTTDAGLRKALDRFRPTFLINAAGYTGIPNVDASESDKSRCLLANTAVPAVIARVCADRGLTWGHLSTGCIYHGTRPDGSGFTEDDAPNFSFRQNNSSFYSGTKALAEEILREFDNVYIWRFRRPFNHRANPRNYLSKVLSYDRLLEATNSITWIDDLLRACEHCWTERPPTGIYHITNPGIVSTSEIHDLLKRYRVTDKTFTFFSSIEEFHRLAGPTPRSECVLNSDKIQRSGVRLTEVHEALEKSLRAWPGND